MTPVYAARSPPNYLPVPSTRPGVAYGEPGRRRECSQEDAKPPYFPSEELFFSLLDAWVTEESHGERSTLLFQFVALASTASPRPPQDARICAVWAYTGRYGKSPAPDGVGPF